MIPAPIELNYSNPIIAKNYACYCFGFLIGISTDWLLSKGNVLKKTAYFSAGIGMIDGLELLLPDKLGQPFETDVGLIAGYASGVASSRSLYKKARQMKKSLKRAYKRFTS